MGIKHYWGWFRKTYADYIYTLKKDEKMEELCGVSIKDPRVDNVMIDMNGIFHTSAQRVYCYGNFKNPPRLLGKNVKGFKKQIDVFRDICDTIDSIVKIVEPTKRVILCVDGPAPLSKQNQQRQRRFVSARDRDVNSTFDSNSLTPGTKFMDNLTRYVDWHIKRQLSDDSSKWSGLEVIFSNEKAPGEGEHKLINYIRRHGTDQESYCIHGMDADLIMLSLGTHMPRFWILREEPVDPNIEFYAIDIGSVRKAMGESMRWTETESKTVYDPVTAIDDFIFMCFTVGNDFLPHMPSIEIIDGGINIMLDVYKNVGKSYGHLTKKVDGVMRFRKKALKTFLGTVSQYEKGSLEDKLSRKGSIHPDKLLMECVSENLGKREVDVESYRELYYKENLSGVDNLEKYCHDYLDGMLWVINYYKNGVPDWKWRFEYHYAPFAYTLAEHVDTYKFKEFPKTQATLPFIQLMCVLPPKSAGLLPEPLSGFLSSKESKMARYCPEKFPIDMSGKRHEWEGTVLLPMVNYSRVERWCGRMLPDIDPRDVKRNIVGKSFVYVRSKRSFYWESFYGNFECKVAVRPIEI
jgi:5'-3' exonuclease